MLRTFGREYFTQSRKGRKTILSLTEPTGNTEKTSLGINMSTRPREADKPFDFHQGLSLLPGRVAIVPSLRLWTQALPEIPSSKSYPDLFFRTHSCCTNVLSRSQLRSPLCPKDLTDVRGPDQVGGLFWVCFLRDLCVSSGAGGENVVHSKFGWKLELGFRGANEKGDEVQAPPLWVTFPFPG